MRREWKSFLVGRLALALVVALTAILTPVPPTARAQTATETGYEEAGTAGYQVERWWGAAGAVLCGAEIALIRNAPPLGMNPYAIAAGLSGCILAGLDIITSD